MADQLIFYDGSTTLGAAPTIGDVTMIQQIQSYAADGTPTYLTTRTITVDQYGRTRTVKDASSHTITTAYTPASGAAPTSVKVTDPLIHATTTAYDPLRGLPITVTDPASYVTSEQYDALGRLRAVYKPGRTTGNPNLAYTYTVSNSAPSVVNTYTLNEDGTQRLSETLYDSMLRAREVQTQTPDGNRDITDTTYNTDGWVSTVTAAYYNANPVSTTYVEAPAGQVDAQTGYLYDGAGRTTDTIAYHLGTETWRTSYVYGGNFTTVIPPAGATAATTVTDGRGRRTHLIQYLAGVPTDYVNDPPSDYTDTAYTYTPDGKPATQTDPAGNSWSWKYNLLGQQTDAYDPDTGHTVSTYDNVGNLKTVTNVTDNNKQTTYVYDNDNRKTASYDTTTTSTLTTANQIGKWTYDTLKKGLLTSTVSYSAGDVYTRTVLSYNSYGLPGGDTVTLTGTDATLVPAGGYTTGYGYSITGLYKDRSDPAEGDLPAEDVGTGYDAFAEPTSLASIGDASWIYVSAVGYDHYGHPLRYTMPTVSGNAWIDLSYDAQTWQLTGVRTTDSTTSGDVDKLTYTYSSSTVSKGAGLLTKTVDTSNAGATVDTQCFTYDYAQRLTQAWTATDNCAATPQPGHSSTVGGPTAPYWQSWTYDTGGAGLRATQTDHDPKGVVANDTTTTYHYPTPGSSSDQPHTLSNTTATGPNATANTATYTYDPSGNTKTITGGALGNQTLTWNNQGKLATDQTSAGTTTYVYDADGNLLARRNPGTTTLYLGDAQLVQNTTTGAVSGTRYYTINGATIAARTSTAVTILVPDRQGTNQLSIATTADQKVTRRQYLPFGQPRGTIGTFPGDKGYIGGQNDTTTKLENLGAREYNPQTGRFLSPDPIFEAGDPNQLNGYDYAANNPVTGSDPTGLMLDSRECNAACKAIWWNARQTGSTTPKAKLANGIVVTVHRNGQLELNGVRLSPDFIHDVSQYINDVDMYYGGQFKNVHDPSMRVLDALTWACGTVINKVDNCEPVLEHQLTEATVTALDRIKHNCTGPCEKTQQFIRGVGGAIVVSSAALVNKFGVGMSEMADDLNNLAEGRCSFDQATPVLLADGSSKPIKDIKRGDKVKATDPTTGKTSNQPVTALHLNLDTQLADLTVRTGDGNTAVLNTTQNHPFYDLTRKTWVAAGDLQPGDQLYTTSGIATVTAVYTFVHADPMYNLTVNQVHTYYVIAGNTPVLVHNSGCGGDAWTSATRLTEKFGKHGAEMGTETEAEYREAAIDLTCSCDGYRTNVLHKYDSVTGKSYFYDTESGEFAITYPSGIDTYYHLEGGIDSFNGMPGAPVNY